MSSEPAASLHVPVPPLSFLAQVSAATASESRLEMCIQCGTCGGSCPAASDMDHSPRQLFAMVRAGFRDEVLSSNTPWMCVSCYHCVVRCPQDVQITHVMYALKAMAIAAGRCRDSTGPDFSRTFVGMVETYGRSYELGLATRHYLKHFPLRLASSTSIGLGMLTKRRLRMRPRSIDGLGQLQAILARARALEAS